MESKTVMLVNTVLLTTFICEDINGTFIAFGGDVTFWKQKKYWYFTENHITFILTLYIHTYSLHILYFLFLFLPHNYHAHLNLQLS